MRKWLIGSIAFIMVQGCTQIDDFMLGKDNTPKPAALQPVTKGVPVKVLWSFPVGQTQKAYALKLKPAIHRGHIYFADTAGLVTAMDQHSGHVLWTKSLKQPVTSGPVVHDGIIALGTGAATSVLLNANNGEEMSVKKVSGDVLSKPLIAHHTLYTKTIDGNVYAFDIASGKELWVVEHGSPSLILQASSSPVLYGNLILVGFSDGRLDAIDPQNGRVLWQKSIAYASGSSDVERLVDIDADPIVRADVVFLASYQGYVGALSLSNGQFLWSKPASVYKNMILDGETLYYVDHDDSVWAVDRQTGQVKWKQTALKARGLTAPALINHRLVVGDKTGLLHVLSKDKGELVGREQLDSAIVTDPMASGHHLYVVTAKGRLYRLGVGL